LSRLPPGLFLGTKGVEQTAGKVGAGLTAYRHGVAVTCRRHDCFHVPEIFAGCSRRQPVNLALFGPHDIFPLAQRRRMTALALCVDLLNSAGASFLLADSGDVGALLTGRPDIICNAVEVCWRPSIAGDIFHGLLA
jgi:hypothetical protein